MELLKAPQARLPHVPSSDPPALDARSVGEAAERLVLGLAVPRDRAFAALYNYLVVDEPAVHLMPLHFLPRSTGCGVGRGDLQSLGVAAKLEYARSRWVDEIIDAGRAESLLAAHGLHDELVKLVFERYSEVLRDRAAGDFFRTLAGLYARHGASLAVDGSRPRRPSGPLTEEDYSAQVHARNGSFRASLDAVLLLAGVPEDTLQTARQSWHMWVLGAQLYDDALDVEEDFESESLTWTVARTLNRIGPNTGTSRRPDRDTFYEAALADGSVVETLVWAETCFRSAASLADAEFPSWAALQRACITQTSTLRTDFQSLAAGLARKWESRREG